MVFVIDGMALETIEGQDAALHEQISLKLRADAIAKTNQPRRLTPYRILRKNDQGEVIAAVFVTSFWEWRYIDLLWVDEDYRKQGYGAQLVRAVEERAKEENAVGLYVFSGSFQAPAFYEKLGYVRLGLLEDCPRGYQRIGLMKRMG